jgi:DNA invertase Pin-like site-specific DNA recombinase
MRAGGLLSGADGWCRTPAQRTLIRARTREGRERAKARGVRFGRPKKLSVHQRREAIDRIEAGEAVADVARTFGVDRATLYRLKP